MADVILDKFGRDLSSNLVSLEKISLQREAAENGSDLYCVRCDADLPKREPFFVVDMENGNKEYYCPICDYSFR